MHFLKRDRKKCLTCQNYCYTAKSEDTVDILQKVSVPFVPLSQCKMFWGSLINERKICAGQKDADSCAVSIIATSRPFLQNSTMLPG